MYLHMVWGNWITIREDKAERNEDGPKSDENVTAQVTFLVCITPPSVVYSN